ncbi:uncharacterized protein BKCO1_27000122 [Diplodia corticola]|uniref:Uncharacterized protein n=1 Tax=Diplodia corticola TaxID=236234 RepID=A0A1J9QZN2_9PEZI|nr:uncharacterized protein BKCO1_27000122 [Diplodia corticola]OJD33848.1 hypothetical protein BKCO1_27000122 [Diplodia corticola]
MVPAGAPKEAYFYICEKLLLNHPEVCERSGFDDENAWGIDDNSYGYEAMTGPLNMTHSYNSWTNRFGGKATFSKYMVYTAKARKRRYKRNDETSAGRNPALGLPGPVVTPSTASFDGNGAVDTTAATAVEGENNSEKVVTVAKVVFGTLVDIAVSRLPVDFDVRALSARLMPPPIAMLEAVDYQGTLGKTEISELHKQEYEQVKRQLGYTLDTLEAFPLALESQEYAPPNISDHEPGPSG